MSSQDKNSPYEILTLSHFGFKYCSVDRCCNAFTTNHKLSLLRHIKNIHESDVKKVILKEEKIQKHSQKRVQGGVHKCQEVVWCT